MKTVRIAFYEYMRVENLALSTVLEYLKLYDAVKKTYPDFDEWQSDDCISYLSKIDNPITISNKNMALACGYAD